MCVCSHANLITAHFIAFFADNQYLCVYMCMRLFMLRVCVCTCVCVCMHVSILVGEMMCVDVCVCLYVCVSGRAHACTCVHVPACALYVHVYTCVRVCVMRV